MGNVLTFNDLPDVPSSGNFTAYQGFHFEANNIPGVSDESQSIAYSNDPSTFYAGWHSLVGTADDQVPQVSFFASDTLKITEIDGSDFSFFGGDFAQMQGSNVAYTFAGYNNGVQVGQSIVETIGLAEHVNLNMVGVDEVDVTWVAGQFNNLCFDDLLLDPVDNDAPPPDVNVIFDTPQPASGIAGTVGADVFF